MIKKLFIILFWIFLYSTNSLVIAKPKPQLPELPTHHLVSALYENLLGAKQKYHSVWSSSSTDTDTYIAGISSNYPNSSWAGNEMFIAKYNNSTMSLVSSHTFALNAYPYFVQEVDGKLYIGGIVNNGYWQGFINILDPQTYAIINSYTFNSYVLAYDFTIDTDSNIYVIGSRWGQQKYDVFVRKFDRNLMFSGQNDLVITGNGNDYGWDIKYNSTDNNLYIAGYTVNGFEDFPNNPGDAYFVAQCSPVLNDVESLVYVGGSGNEFYFDIDIVINGNSLYLGGGTESIDMPGAVNSLKGNSDAFISMIDISDPGTLSVVKTRYLGGTGDEIMLGDISSANSQAYIYYAGYTTSNDFEEVPVSALQNKNAGGNDIFYAKIHSDLSGAIATYIGGTGDDIAYALSADTTVNPPYLFAAGFTDSPLFPNEPEGLNKIVTQAAFLTRIDNIVGQGDATGEGCVTGLDYSILNTHLIHDTLDELETWQLFAFDLDNDGDVDEDDLNILHDMIAPCPSSGK